MAVLDAGFKMRELQAAKLSCYTVRLAVNSTARRNRLPPSEGGRPPEYGERVRPLARVRNGKLIAATPPDRVETWVEDGLPFRAEFWDDLVLPDVKVRPDTPTFCVVALYDPRFRYPWLLACPLRLSGASLHGLYRDRWPVEQIPVAGKQMWGGACQFVFALESCQRLPELNLFAGSIVTCLAATLPAGYWRGHLFQSLAHCPANLKREAACGHLPKAFWDADTREYCRKHILSMFCERCSTTWGGFNLDSDVPQHPSFAGTSGFLSCEIQIDTRPNLCYSCDCLYIIYNIAIYYDKRNGYSCSDTTP
jgi:hypothetical protein